jgi:hypothetical protein
MDFFVMRYWDVPFEVRGKSAFTMLLGLYPQSVKQGKMQDVFLQPFVEEMQELGKDGVEDSRCLIRTYTKATYQNGSWAQSALTRLLGILLASSME